VGLGDRLELACLLWMSLMIDEQFDFDEQFDSRFRLIFSYVGHLQWISYSSLPSSAPVPAEQS
jgi:hypothetical protein